MMDTITPGKCIVVGTNVHDHGEFVDLCKERLGELLPIPEHEYTREKAVYEGGDYRVWEETPNT